MDVYAKEPLFLVSVSDNNCQKSGMPFGDGTLRYGDGAGRGRGNGGRGLSGDFRGMARYIPDDCKTRVRVFAAYCVKEP